MFNKEAVSKGAVSFFELVGRVGDQIAAKGFLIFHKVVDPFAREL